MYIRRHPNLTLVGNSYEHAEGSAGTGTDVLLPTSWTTENVESWLIVHAMAVNAGVVVDPDTDLFVQGFDRYVEVHLRFVVVLRSQHAVSISATFLRNRIVASLKSSSDCKVQESALRIDQNIVFSSPSIRQLARSVIDAVLRRNGSGAVNVKSDIETMIEKYSVGFGHSAINVSATQVNECSRNDHVVVLTGSTGGLGSYLLASLIQRDDVSVIYTFNRPSRDAASSIQQRQKSSFEDRGLDVTLLHSGKLVYVETDTSHDHLGLDKVLYQKVCFTSSLTRVVC